MVDLGRGIGGNQAGLSPFVTSDPIPETIVRRGADGFVRGEGVQLSLGQFEVGDVELQFPLTAPPDATFLHHVAGGELAWLPAGAFGGIVDWSQIINQPATLAGYGIIDAYTQSQIDAFIAAIDLQAAYAADPTVPQIVVNDGFPLGVELVSGTGDVFVVRDAASADILKARPGAVDIGPVGRRLMSMGFPDATGRLGTELWPDDFTISTATGAGSAFFTDAGRTITLNIPGGGGLGNDTAPGGMNLVHTVRFDDPGFIFASQLLINAAVRVECAANVGPLYLFLDQYRTYADGGAFICSQHNTIRAQPSWGPNINGGSITQTSAILFLLATTVDATVGSAAITAWTGMFINSPNLIAGGTIGTWNGVQFGNIVGPTTITGIQSAMDNGVFINHTGGAFSLFAGDIHMNDGVSLVLGSEMANRVELLRSAAGVMRMIGVGGTNNEGLDWDFDAIANVVGVTSSTGATLRINNRFDINNPIALGGGAAATLGTIGGAGPTAAAQVVWVEIDVGGVPTWFAGWR